jgi:predicted ATPase/class 3 adenylate cyclase/DNA-binding CsgD family transcriptional regulator
VLPSGTLSLLFTDVEASTRAWLRNPQAMSVALARHDQLIERLVARHGGHVVRACGEGDSRFAVFARASDAVVAACAAQLALTEERWAVGEPLRVRMAVHTGEAELRLGDYYGPAVNHCARLRAIAHGGQVLVSAVTADLLSEAFPQELSLRDLGHHQLRDLEEPEQVWQLLHPRLPSDFPPLKSLSAKRDNLPNQLTSFVGRHETIAELRRLLVSTRLLTLTGPGGVGKTRLALALAEIVLPDYADGVWLVELAPLTDPGLVPSTVATVLGVQESTKPVIEQLTEALQKMATLVVLDNCEHVVYACAVLSEHLLRRAPNVQILATSRQPIGAEGEVVWRVPGLTVPRLADAPTQPEPFATEAVQLFVERAQAVAPEFRATEHLGAVVDLCRQLDGIPLAIELAAARAKVLAPDQIVARLGDRFKLLVSARRTASDRQRTLRAAVDWSYELLAKSDQALFNQLSVFSGGFALDAAEAVCADPDPSGQIAEEDIPVLIGRLVDQSLLEAESIEGAIRFRLLETLRQFANERLREAGHYAMLRDRHLDWCLTIADSVWSGLGGDKEALWSALVEREYDNMRAALAWALENPSDAEAGLRLAGDLYFFWWRRGYVGEGRAWLAQALDLDARVGTSPTLAAGLARVRALRGAGILAHTQSDYVAADSMFSASVAVARTLDDPEPVADGLYWLGSNALVLGDDARARQFTEESLEFYRQVTDPERAKHAQIHGPLGTLTDLAWRNGDYAQAKVLCEERLRYARSGGDRRGIASVSVALGKLASEQGDHERAKKLLQASRESFSELGDRNGLAAALLHGAHAARARGDRAEAAEQFGASLRIYEELGAVWGIADSLEGLAGIAGDLGQSECAAQLFSSAAALRETAGFRLPPQRAIMRQRELDALRDALGPNRFETAWRIGRDQAVSDAVAASLAITSEEPRKPMAAPKLQEGNLLTAREFEVATLIARGRSNREIAEELVIAVSTAERHVANILGKLNLASRAQVVGWVLGQAALRSS